MRKKYELKLLKELIAIAEDPKGTSGRYGAIYLGWAIGGCIVVFLVIVFLNNDVLTPPYAVFGGFVSGVMIGLGIYYNSAKMQIPVIKKYCPPKKNEIQQRIDEIDT